MTEPPLVVVQLSDLHLDGAPRAAARAGRVVEHVLAMDPPPDVVVVTGDLADHGLPQEYAEVGRLLGRLAPVPVLVCPGNHDRREPMTTQLLGGRVGLTGAGEPGPVNQAFDIGGVRFLMCDSSIPGRDEGLLDDTTLDWLEEQLAGAAGTPSFVCFHHPPVSLHVPSIDALRLLEPERLASVLRRHEQVVAVLCGHAHTAAASTFAGRPVLVAPGVVSTLVLASESAMVADGAVIDPALPPAFTVHVWADQRLTSHVRALSMG